MQWSMVVISTLFPLLCFLPVKGVGPSFYLYLLILLSLICIACRFRPAGKGFLERIGEHWPLHLAMAGMLGAVLASQLVNGHTARYELPLQLACFPLVLWGLLFGSFQQLRQVQWGLAAGVLLCTAALYMETAAMALRPEAVALGLRPNFVLGMPLVPFTNMTVMMGVLVLFSIGWNNKGDKLEIALKLLTGAVAVYASYLSLTRSSWVAYPVFVIIALLVFRNMQLRLKLAIFAMMAGLFFGTYLFSDAVKARVRLAHADIELFVSAKEKNTSLGQRLQLWQASWEVFKEHPVAGTGREHYRTTVQKLAERQIITPLAATQPHMHSDLLFHMATLGLFGLAAILALYLAPAYYFLKEVRHPDRETRTIAGMGCVLALGFFVFGLSDTMFYWRVSYAFYIILLAVLFAGMVRRKESLAGASGSARSVARAE